jgi:hypothetical protein
MSSNEPKGQGFRTGLNEGTLGLTMAAILLFTAVIWAAHSPNVEKADFSLTYVGAMLVHSDLGSRLYDIELQKQTRDTLFQHPSPLLFEHPPFEALIFAPLAHFSYRTAYMIWGLANATIWFVLMIVMRSHLHWPREDLGYIVLWFLFAPIGVALYQGQSSILLLGVYAACFLQLRRGNDFLAGLLLAVGLIKLQFVLAFFLIFLMRKKWYLVSGFVTSTVCLTFLSILTVGWRGIVEYGRFLIAIGSHPNNVSFGSGVDMPTIHGFVFATMGHWLSPYVLQVLVAGASLALLGWVAWRWNSLESQTGSDLMFASAISASLLAGSHMFTHDFSPLLLAMFIVGAELTSVQTAAARRRLRIVLVPFWAFPVYFLCVVCHCMFLLCPILLLFTWVAAESARNATRSHTDQLELAVNG